jgi:predicted MFS family arabinose efflux permease
MGRLDENGELAVPKPDGVFSIGEFRWLWLSYAQSVGGDQLARVALSVLVFSRTGSPAWTAATYALTMLPALASGVLLSGLADRFPRRVVMVNCDLVRAAVVGIMAIPGMPLPVVASLLVLAQLAEAPFGAAQGALLPVMLGPSRYGHGQRIIMVTHQAGQAIGFVAGGLLVAWLGTHLSLAVDAATFLLSALLIRSGVRARPAPATSGAARPRLLGQVSAAARLIWSDRRLRALTALGWLAGFVTLPDGLAVPFAVEVGAGAAAGGLLLAARPAGLVLGAFLLGRRRVGEERRRLLLGPLAVGTTLPLACYLFAPGLAVAVALRAVSGICSAYQTTASATFMLLTPDHQRGQAFGLIRSGIIAVQGVGVAAGGLLAGLSGTVAGTIGTAGIAGTLCATGAATAWSRSDRKPPRASPEPAAATMPHQAARRG